MAHNEFPIVPSDPYQWSESVLSTRSLSWVSQGDDTHHVPHSRQVSIGHSHPRKNTLESISDLDAAEEQNEEEEDGLSMMPSLPSTPPLPFTVANSPLFRLPRELRETIYTHLLTSSLGFSYPTDTLSRSLSPTILRTCAHIYTETAPLLYRSNKLIFSHPSDANMFRHSLAAEPHAAEATAMIVRIKNSDARLWTSYFNSSSQERSLVRDYPRLKTLYVRFRGPRYQPFLTPEQNAANWLRDAKLQEIIVSVRKCVPDVRVELCVKVLADDFSQETWERAVVRVVAEQERQFGDGAAAVLEGGAAERKTIRLNKVENYVELYGVLIKLETDGT